MPKISKAREAEVRARILEAGLRVFEAQGFRRASMQAVAAEAGMSVGGVYTHVASKEALFIAAFDALWEAEERDLERAIAAQATTIDRLRVAADAFIDSVVVRDQPGFAGMGAGFLLHGWTNASEMPELRSTLARRRDHVETLIRVLLLEGMARGDVAAWTDVEALASIVGSALDGLLLQRAERGPDFDRGRAARQVAALAQAILGSAAAPFPPPFDLAEAR